MARRRRQNRATLTLASAIPTPRLVPFDVKCGKPDPTETLVAIAPLSSGQHVLTAPIGATSLASGTRCEVTKGGKRLGTLTLHVA